MTVTSTTRKVTATEEDAYNLECDDGHVNGEHCEVYNVEDLP